MLSNSLLTNWIVWIAQSHFLSFVLFLLCLSAIVYYSVAIYATTEFFSQPTHVDPVYHPPISILKPICGLDEWAYQNLVSFCQQDYPNYQIIFGVQDPTDPSIHVVKRLIRNFPDLDIQLIVSDRAIGANQKICNLANALAAAKHEILILADSDIRVQPDYLHRVVQPLCDPSVGVVTCMYRSFSKGWLAAFEALSITTDFFPGVMVARKLEGVAFAFGATIAIRRSVLDEIGGLFAFANYLADDYQLGNLPHRAGYQIVLSNYVVEHVMGTKNFADFLHHQMRWARGIRFTRTTGYLGLIFSYGTVSSMLFLLMTGGAWFGWAVLVMTWGCRLLLAWFVGVKSLKDVVARKCLWLVPLRDFVSFGVWCCSFLGNTVRWRNQQFRLIKGGILVADGLVESLQKINALSR